MLDDGSGGSSAGIARFFVVSSLASTAPVKRLTRDSRQP